MVTTADAVQLILAGLEANPAAARDAAAALAQRAVVIPDDAAARALLARLRALAAP